MTNETLTNIGAVGALISPAWLPVIGAISQLAGMLLPILGAAWLLVQIVTKIIETHRGRKVHIKDDNDVR